MSVRALHKASLALLCAMLANPTLAAGRLINISSRALAGTGADTLTAGFVITGSAQKKILVRGAGPALAAQGVSGTLTEARVELFQGSTSLGANSHWDAAPNGTAIAQTATAVGAFAFAAGSNDAALLVTLAPGAYTAQVTPARAGVASGVALVEVYDADPSSASQLINLSTRAHAGTGAATLIAGFVFSGDTANRVLVRAAGPALTAFGLGGALADPRLEIFQSNASIAYNDDWQGNTNAAQLALVAKNSGAFDFAAGSKDAALLLPQASGAYTAQVVEAPDAGGVALIEVYDTAAYQSLPPARTFDLVGFARAGGDGLTTFTGGGAPTTNYDPVAHTGNFWRIDDATLARANFAAELQAALGSATPLVVELNTMIDLSRFAPPYNDTNSNPIAHPDLIPLGHVGRLQIGSNKTIYSAYGNGGFKRGTVNLGGSSNVALRNLKFRELWEWDDATNGQYDRNGWDYLVVQSVLNPNGTVATRAHHIWIDHCDFEKAYDGLTDVVHGSDLVTMSWCKIAGVVSGESLRWVRRQLDYLEANRARFTYYDYLRGFGTEDQILAGEVFHKKANLIGNSTDATTRAQDTGYLNITSHHNWFINVDDRMPRMRFGNAHVFNLLADSRAGVNLFGLSRDGIGATVGAAVRLDSSTFLDVRVPVDNRTNNETPGLITVLNSANLDSASQIDRGFDATRTVPLSDFAWNPVPASSGLGTWPSADTSVMPAGYVPAGATLATYVDDKNYLGNNLAYVGVITPADEGEAALLRARWQATTAPR